MTSLRELITNNRYFYHYLFWAIVILSYMADAAGLREFSYSLFWKTIVLKNGLLIAIVYFHLRVLVPAFLTPKKYWAYAFSLLITIAGGAFMTNQIEKT